SLKTSIKTITYLSDTGCLEIQGASLGVNYGRRVGKCCLSAFKIATKSNHKSRLQHIFLIYIQIMT
ncbi:hypothetical protein, partial [Escherichia coli]|uniref:hypothetical protein n=1 Tax=Escherichia coli TaxID=562 RepID=UPI001A7E17B5